MKYTYNLSGGLKSFTDPFGSEAIYTHDKMGRLTKVDGDAFGDNTAGRYADNIKYRVFGQVKQMNYKTEDDALVSLDYDNRLRVLQYQVAWSEASGGYLKKAQFAYLADSRPQAMDDQVNAKFDRTYQYDFAGRLPANQLGSPQASTYPYAQTIQYDRFSQMTGQTTTHWRELRLEKFFSIEKPVNTSVFRAQAPLLKKTLEFFSSFETIFAQNHLNPYLSAITFFYYFHIKTFNCDSIQIGREKGVFSIQK